MISLGSSAFLAQSLIVLLSWRHSLAKKVKIKPAGCSFNLLYVQLVLLSMTRVENVLCLSLPDLDYAGLRFPSWEECQLKNSVIFENDSRQKLQRLFFFLSFQYSCALRASTKVWHGRDLHIRSMTFAISMEIKKAGPSVRPLKNVASGLK